MHHEEPPIYTGDRLHPKGVLLFTIFGKEMVDKVRACCLTGACEGGRVELGCALWWGARAAACRSGDGAGPRYGLLATELRVTCQ